ncbi:hypothetical protein ABIB82_003607 [Bradyrhizobium sp. i1.8.4]
MDRLARPRYRRHSPICGSDAANNDDKKINPGNAMAATRIDCDIHPAVGGTRTTLLPYLSDHWKARRWRRPPAWRA